MNQKKITIKIRLYWFKNLMIMLYCKILHLFDHKYDKSVIPEGLYCYAPDIEKNGMKKDWTTYYVIPCPYYLTLGRHLNGCKYLGCITDDFVFDDQCKMCKENYGDENDIK